MVEAYECPLCLDVFEAPIIINCGNNHSFCTECIKAHSSQGFSECPVCRQKFDIRNCTVNIDINHAMQNSTAQCIGCHEIMRVMKLRGHMSSCRAVNEQESRTLQRHTVSNPALVQVPNRHTFKCPYCSADHLDHKTLTSHCNSHHLHEKHPVVCPICVSMPWGDPNFKSVNFISHLNLRHKFEYETYVDFQENDDAMMAAALRASLVEK